MARRSLFDVILNRNNGEASDRLGRPIVASASVVNLTDRSEAIRLSEKSLEQKWQADAWAYRKAIGEVRFSQNWLGTGVSRMRLFPAVLVEGAEEPVPIDDAQTPPPDSDLDPAGLPERFVADVKQAMASLGDPGTLLERGTVSLEVAGEFYLVGYIDGDQKECWEVRNRQELVRTDYGVVLKGAPTYRTSGQRPAFTHEGGTLLDPTNSYVARVWRKDGQWTDLADSPMSGVISHCELLLILERKARGNARSRLSAPLLIVPAEDESARKRQPDPNNPGRWIEPKSTGTQVMEHMVTPIGDESAASAVAPIAITSTKPKEWTTIDVGRNSGPEDSNERAEALDRILQGLDVDGEVVKGMGGVKFANQKAITEDRFRYFLEPKVLTLVHALTTTYLHIRLGALGWDSDLIDRVCVWYDPSALVTNPNLSQDAIAVFNLGEMSGASLRKYTGFGEGDAPSDDERQRFLMIKTRKTPADLELPVPDIADGEPSAEPPAGNSAAARVERVRALVAAATQADPQPSDLGSRLLQIDLALFGRVQAAADAAMRRALERAGARARSAAQHKTDAPSGTTNDRLVSVLGKDGITQLGLSDEDLLAGDPFADLASRFQVWAAASFEQALRAYARALGLTYYPPSTDEVTAALTAAAGLPPFSDLGGIDFVSLREQAALDAGTASEALKARLTARAAELLYSDGDPGEGEVDPTMTVPAGPIRAAIARAGGADSAPGSAGIDDDGRPLSDSDQLPGGLASGWSLREASARAGLKSYAYVWSHGAGGNPFEPHLVLDRQIFADQGDRRLAKSPADFPKGTTSYYPGDHWGCTCWTEFLYADPFANMSPADARQARAAQKARDDRGRFAGRNDHPDDTPGVGTTPRQRT